MRIDSRNLSFLIVALVAAALFTRLGFWQMDRLAERRATNALAETRLAAAPLDPATAARLPADSLPWRRAALVGRYDLEREIVVRARFSGGTPGAELLTPLLPAGEPETGARILVLRGWLPSADGVRVDLSAGSPRVTGPIRGVIHAGSEPRPEVRHPTIEIDGSPHTVMMGIDLEAAAASLPYPIADYYVRVVGPFDEPGQLRPPRAPTLDDGPHLMYAIQWFCFALIALVGTWFYLRKA